MITNSELEEDKNALNAKLSHLAWYHGNISRTLAETRLDRFTEEGMFLIRQNMLCPTEFVLSLFHDGKCYHYMIENIADDYYFKMPKGDPHEGLDNLVKYHHEAEHGLPSRLLSPCPEGTLPPSYSITVGYTNLLHAAVNEGNTNLVKAILCNKRCPDLNWKDETGITALHLACMQGKEEIALCLLQCDSIKVNVLDVDGYTPLHRACQSNHSTLVRMLIKANANPQKSHKETQNVPLHEAALGGHKATVKALLSCHVPAWPRNGKQQTPYDLAIKYSHTTVANILDGYKPPPPKTKKEYWLHEQTDRQNATAILMDKGMQSGYFLVRRSDVDKYALSLYCNNNIHHFRINSYEDKAFYFTSGPLLQSIEMFVEHYCCYYDGLPHLLTHAIDKDGVVRSMENGAIVDKVSLNPVMVEALPPRLKPPTGKDFLEIKLQDLELGAELGQGEYGSVLRGKWKIPHLSGEVEWQAVAIKTLNEDLVTNDTESFLAEAKVMLNFDHPCIVRLIGVCHGPPLMLIQELLPNGSLLDFLLDYPERINLRSDIFRWAGQIAMGMNYLESKKFVHRDLAARNILLKDKTKAKVGDFGLSRAVGDNEYYRATKGGRWPVKWYAPECMYYGTFTHHSDVWSYGVLLWEMYSLGEQPYSNQTGSQVVEMIERGERLSRPNNCPENVYAKMLQCWQYEPMDRPAFKTLFNFFKSMMVYTNVK